MYSLFSICPQRISFEILWRSPSVEYSPANNHRFQHVVCHLKTYRRVIFAVRFASPQLPRWNEPEPRYLLMLFAINQLQLTHLQIHSSKCPQTSVMPPIRRTVPYRNRNNRLRIIIRKPRSRHINLSNRTSYHYHSRPHRPLNRPGIRTSPSRFSHQSPHPNDPFHHPPDPQSPPVTPNPFNPKQP